MLSCNNPVSAPNPAPAFPTTADQCQTKVCSSGILRSGRLTLSQGQFITNQLFKLSGCLNGVVRLICLKSLLVERGTCVRARPVVNESLAWAFVKSELCPSAPVLHLVHESFCSCNTKYCRTFRQLTGCLPVAFALPQRFTIKGEKQCSYT